MSGKGQGKARVTGRRGAVGGRASRPSARIVAFVEALPLRPGMRVLEIGCGPGAAARLVCERIGDGFVLGVDRSARAIAQARASCRAQLALGRLAFRQERVEDLALTSGETRFDLAFAMRVGALDGRHPELQARALSAVAACLKPGARLFIDGGDPLKEVPLEGDDDRARPRSGDRRRQSPQRR